MGPYLSFGLSCIMQPRLLMLCKCFEPLSFKVPPGRLFCRTRHLKLSGYATYFSKIINAWIYFQNYFRTGKNTGFFSADLAPMCKPKVAGIPRLKTLDQFESRQEVLFALRDAIASRVLSTSFSVCVLHVFLLFSASIHMEQVSSRSWKHIHQYYLHRRY